jgi:hypothetical protein
MTFNIQNILNIVLLCRVACHIPIIRTPTTLSLPTHLEASMDTLLLSHLFTTILAAKYANIFNWYLRYKILRNAMEIRGGYVKIKGITLIRWNGLITAARAVNRIYKQVLTMLNSHAVQSFNRYNPNYNKHRGTKQEIKETIPKILTILGNFLISTATPILVILAAVYNCVLP